MARGDVRATMVAGAVRLLAEKGPPGASFGSVLELTGASRGSTYHHFPGGKRELYASALDLASGQALAAMESVRGQSPAVVVERFVGLWRQLLEVGCLRIGCAVLAVAVAGEDPESVEHSGRIFREWRAYLAALFAEGGLAGDPARTLAALTVAAIEGAVAVARAEGDIEPFDLVAEHVIQVARTTQ